MSSPPRLEITGQAPFKQTGVYEVQIAILDSKPSEDTVRSKKFTSLWRGNFHLRVKDGVFSETCYKDICIISFNYKHNI